MYRSLATADRDVVRVRAAESDDGSLSLNDVVSPIEGALGMVPLATAESPARERSCVMTAKSRKPDEHGPRPAVPEPHANGGYVLTDDGYVLADLEISGCKIESPKRQEILKMTLNGFGIQLNGQALEVRTAADSFPAKKHNLVQAMLAVNNLFHLAAPSVASLVHIREDEETIL